MTKLIDEKTLDFIENNFEHLHLIAEFMGSIQKEMMKRMASHDNSKLSPIEIEGFVEKSPELKKMEYGSPEYFKSLESFKEVLKHHYDNNRHHPEHFGDAGVSGMNVIDLLEMICDWSASSQRMATKDFFSGLPVQKDRFNLDPQLYSIIVNTMEFLTGEICPDEIRNILEAVPDNKQD
jgi:hypothetical protein